MAKTIKIDLAQDVTQSLPFEPFPEFNDLCMGFMTDINISQTVSKTREAGSKWEYAGMEVPQLAITFTQYKKVADEKTRLFFHRELSIATINVKGQSITDKNLESMYMELWKRLYHIHNQYKGFPNYKPITTAPEFNPHASKVDRVKAFGEFFKFMVDAFKKGKGNKPIYEPYDNTDKVGLMVMKLIASGDENDKLEFPHFVGSGFIENYAVDVNGQLDTTLKLGPRETVKLGTSGKGLIPTGVGSSASKVTDEIAAKLMG